MNTISQASSSSSSTSFGFPHFQHQHPFQTSSLSPLLNPRPQPQHEQQPSYQSTPADLLGPNMFSIPTGEEVRCLWTGCDVKVLKEEVEMLYSHICNDHIGRKTKQNLTLICRWNGCEKVHSKRDHVTSHVRIHLPLKPHSCETCSKTFKRPQDLKKHERVHSAAHQAKLKHPRTAYALAANDDDSSNSAVPTPPAAPQSASSSNGSVTDDLLEGRDTHRQKRRRRESSVTSNASSEVFPSRKSQSPPRVPPREHELVASYDQ